MLRSLPVLGLLLAVGCAGAPAPRAAAPAPRAAPAPEAPRVAPAPVADVRQAPTEADPRVESLMEQYAQESRMRREERRAISEHYFRVGKAFYDELDYLQARKNFELALGADPENRVAERHLQATQALLGDRAASVREVADALADRQVAGRDQKRLELQRLFDQGMRHMDAGDYDQAIVQFERVLEEIRWYPHAYEDGDIAFAQRAQAQLERAREAK